jgi:hypothetical protein
MTTQANPGISRERDILEVMREIERGQVKASDTARARDEGDRAPETKSVPDPDALLSSLKAKRDLLNLLDGYSEAKDIVKMKSQLNEAIDFLEALNLDEGDEAEIA